MFVFLLAVGFLDVANRIYIKKMFADSKHYSVDVNRYKLIKGIILVNFVLYTMLFIIAFLLYTHYMDRVVLIVEYLLYISFISCLDLHVRHMDVVLRNLIEEDALFYSKETLEAEKNYFLVLNIELILTSIELTGLFIITAIYLISILIK